MESWLGGGVLLAVAAALWLVYLVPNWLRRNEYLATERNAVRLQQTIRVLAETAETPEAVRLESAAQARALESRLRRGEVRAEGLTEDPRVTALARLRKTRIATTVVIAIAALVLLSQLIVAIVNGVAAVAPMAVIVGGALFVTAVWLQGRLVKATRAQRAAFAEPVRSRTASSVAAAYRAAGVEAEVAVDPRAWTPQPLPQPMAQVRRQAALAAAAEAAREARARESEERLVAARAALAARAPAEPAYRDPVAASSRPRAEEAAQRPSRSEPATVSRFAAMGVLTAADTGAVDLDAALARRRAS